MRSIFIFIFLLLSTLVCSGQTQAEMNQSEQKKYMKADKELNTIYQKILKEYKEDTVFVRNLKNSQKLWRQLRDAEMKVKYPNREPGYYGSAHAMCLSIYLTELTNERIRKLKIWLDGIEEGDVCSGSIKTKK